VLNDLDARMSFAYTMNQMGPGAQVDFRGISIALALMGALMEQAAG
jgi:hypothetical protein